MDELNFLAKKVQNMKKECFNSYKNTINYIIGNNIQDTFFIEHVLDNLIDCVYDKESYNYCVMLCQYYKNIDKESSNFYLKLLKEEYK